MKQSNNIQPWRTPFPTWIQSVVPCPVLTVASWRAYRFLKGQVRWSDIPISFKIFQARLQQYVNRELPDVQAAFSKAEEPEIKLLISVGWQKKQENTRKTSTSALLTRPKPLTVWITINCGKWEKGTSDHLTCLMRNLYAGQESNN